MRLKWRTFAVSTEKPRERAVAPMRRSGKWMGLPFAVCSPSMSASDFGYLLRIGVDLQFRDDGGEKVPTPLSAHVGISSIEAMN